MLPVRRIISQIASKVEELPGYSHLHPLDRPYVGVADGVSPGQRLYCMFTAVTQQRSVYDAVFGKDEHRRLIFDHIFAKFAQVPTEPD